MDPIIVLGIVAAVVVIAAVAFFVLRSKGEEDTTEELPRETERKPREPSPKAAAKAKKAEAPKKTKPAEEKAPPAEAAPAETAADEGEDEEDDAEEPPADSPEETTPEEASAPDEPAEAAAEERSEPSKEDIKALKKGLASMRGGFIARLASLFSRKKEIDPDLLDELQEVLITADIGVKTTDKILASLKERMDRKELEDEDRVWAALREEANSILHDSHGGLRLGGPPACVLVVGVNGVGKTTTIGKLASRYKDEGKKVILAAGDTFRAAAVLQLEVWGRRVGCDVVKGKDRADPASVVFDAVKRAEEEEADVVIVDTAGRLHTKANLMEELKKVVRTAEKALGRPVDEILLVLDSTTGQNAIQQAQLFKDAIEVSGIALTKLDGTAKGGVILGIVDQHSLPVHFVGIGERVEDLREFDAPTFVEALFAKPDDETMAA